MRFLIGGGTVLALVAASCLADESHPGGEFQIALGEIREHRTSERPGTLEVGLNLTGTRIARIQHFQVFIDKAVDDGGADLSTPQKPDSNWGRKVEANNFNHETLMIATQLKVSARSTNFLREFAGAVAITIPELDKSSVVTVNAVKQQGHAVTSLTATQLDVKINALSRAQYAAQRESERQKNPPPVALPDPTRALRPGAPAFANFGKITEPDTLNERSFAYRVQDPNHKLLDLVFLAPDGTELRPSSRRQFFNADGDTRIYEFARIPSPDTRVRFVLISKAATIRLPFSFKDIAIP